MLPVWFVPPEFRICLMTTQAEVLGVTSSAFAPKAAPGAVRPYEAALRTAVPKVVGKLGIPASPMTY